MGNKKAESLWKPRHIREGLGGEQKHPGTSWLSLRLVEAEMSGQGLQAGSLLKGRTGVRFHTILPELNLFLPNYLGLPFHRSKIQDC